MGRITCLIIIVGRAGLRPFALVMPSNSFPEGTPASHQNAFQCMYVFCDILMSSKYFPSHLPGRVGCKQAEGALVCPKPQKDGGSVWAQIHLLDIDRILLFQMLPSHCFYNPCPGGSRGVECQIQEALLCLEAIYFHGLLACLKSPPVGLKCRRHYEAFHVRDKDNKAIFFNKA